MPNPNLSPTSNVIVWKTTERIIHTGVLPHSREMLMELVEPPLQPAVGNLYDKNIQTLGSSCNYQDYIRGRATITLAADSLSGQNNTIASLYPGSVRETSGMGFGLIGLMIPIDPNESPLDISKKALGVAEQFVIQPFSWVPKWSLKEARSHFKRNDGPDFTTMTDEALADEFVMDGYYFDPETGFIFLNEEQYLKAKNAPTKKIIDITEA